MFYGAQFNGIAAVILHHKMMLIPSRNQRLSMFYLGIRKKLESSRQDFLDQIVKLNVKKNHKSRWNSSNNFEEIKG